MDYRKVRGLGWIFGYVENGGKDEFVPSVKIMLGYVYMCVSGEWYLCKREAGVFVLLSWLICV